MKRGVLATSIGTSGVMFVHAETPEYDPAGRLHTFCHAVRGKWHMMGVTLTAGGALQWFRNELCKADTKILGASRQRDRPEVYDLLTGEASQVAPGSDGLYFLPYLAGERTPHADPDARGAFVGLTLSHTRGHVVRALMEGVVYALRDSLEIIKECGVPVRQIRASGGGSKSLFWRQLQADILGQPVYSMAADEGPAYGVALLAAVGDGAFKNIQQACAATVEVAGKTTASAKPKRTYNRAFPQFQQLYASLQDDFKRIAQSTR